MRNVTLASSLVASLALLGCGGAERSDESPPARASAGAEQPEARGGMGMQRRGMSGDMQQRCPMEVAGAEVRAEDIDGGVAFTFTTSDVGDVEELRDRVRRMAAHHQQRSEMRRGGRGRGRMMHPPSDSTVVETEDGARLELRATDADDVASLRRHARMRVDRMSAGSCPMMQQMEAAAPASRRAA